MCNLDFSIKRTKKKQDLNAFHWLHPIMVDIISYNFCGRYNLSGAVRSLQESRRKPKIKLRD